MSTSITLPELGENVEGGEVVAVKVSEGDSVREGQALLEVEADKSAVEVPATASGKISKILVKAGDFVETGQTLFELGDADDESDSQQTETKREEEKPSEKGETEKKPEKEESKEKQEEKPENKEKKESEDKANRDAPRKKESDEESKLRDKKSAAGETVPAGPATRRLARELGVDLDQVYGDNGGERVTQDDVKAYVRKHGGGGVSVSAPKLPDFEKWGDVERKALVSIRKKTADHVSASWRLIPHVTQHDWADITQLEKFRKQKKEEGVKLTMTGFALKACAVALREFPNVNASLDAANGEIVLKQYVHIGVAVDTEHGLLVPVVRDVDQKSVQELAKELATIAYKARDRKLSRDDMQGGCFTISNLGGIGGTGFTPIVKLPEVAILGICRAFPQPRLEDGALVEKLMLPLSLSYDHRVVDGAEAARFARRVAVLLENPLEMLLHA